MLTDPITVHVDTHTPVQYPALSLAVIRSDGYGAERRDASGLYALVVNHSTSKNGDRHYVKLTKTVNATNPYNDLVSPQSASISISMSKPKFGFTDLEIEYLFNALLATIGSADAGVSRIIAFES